MDDERMAKWLSMVRVGIGVGAFLAPGLLARAWVGSGGARPAVRPLVRALAARDIALGLGALIAMKRGGVVRGWLEAGVISDAAYAAGTLLSFPRLDGPGRFVVPVTAAGAALLGQRLAVSHSGYRAATRGSRSA